VLPGTFLGLIVIETLSSILKSEFFWSIIIGAVLTGLGSLLIVWLQDRAQRKQRAELVRNFSIDTVQNVRQIIRDLQNLRGRTYAIQHDSLLLLDAEVNVFDRIRLGKQKQRYSEKH
jgi:hypothetical protein